MKIFICILALCSALFTLNVKAVEVPLDQLVKKITEQRKLLRVPECAEYLYIPNGEPGVDIIDVVEKHTGGCPGDPQTQPTIFSVFVDKKTHKMESNIDIDDQVNGTRSGFPPKK
ncbi:hypothetical protein DUP93_09830 [Salmonella enterica subsp. enterica serovar Toulon]|nr:hypothetical protein [Salmonella enterica subsp. enterica serovar Toulon]